METIRIHEVKQPDRAPRLPALLQVWEASVRATHHFLLDAEVKQIRKYVPQALTDVTHLFVKARPACRWPSWEPKWPPGNAVPLPG